MKILMVIPYVPNLISVRPYNLMRQLAARGHALTLVTMVRNEQEEQDLGQLRDHCANVIAFRQQKQRTLWNLLRTLPTRRPLQSAYSWDSRMAGRLSDLVAAADGAGEPYDVVHVEHLRAARYGLHLRGAPVVWDSVDCISLLFERAAKHSRSLFGRWVTRFELGRTRRYEAFLSRQFAHILMTTAGDRDAMLALAGDGFESGSPELPAATTPISVLSNGVDLEYFSPPKNGAREPATVLVSGKMSYHANITMALFMADEIMPRIWARRPDVRLNIVGKDPPASIRALGDDPRINVSGMVPDLRPYLQRATVACAPVQYGVGIQNKVLEAMACATPVVASAQATSALAAKAGEDLFVIGAASLTGGAASLTEGATSLTKGADAFAQAVLRLLGDPDLQRALGSSGRRYVEENHNWSTIAARLENIYREARLP